MERRLGRGLDFFLSRGDRTERKDGAEITEIEVGALKPNPFQPRKEFDETSLRELADSIRANGLLQPILVRRTGTGYEIVAGERRWRAARLAGLERVPAVVREVTDDAAAVFALVENVQRSDLNAIEKAMAFKRLAEVTQAKPDQLSERLGLDRSTIVNFIRLLDLEPSVQALVSRGTLSMGHARALLPLSPEAQRALAEQIVRDRLSVREVESRVQALKETAPKAATKKASAGARPVWLNEIEETIAEALGTKVHVRYGRKRSLITIECAGREEFERVYEKLKGLDGDA